MLVVWAPEQRASPSLLANRLGALNHSLRFSRSRPLPSCCRMHHEVSHRVTQLFIQSTSDFARGFAASDLSPELLISGCSCMVHRVVELIKITDVTRCSGHHWLLMISTILSQLCSDSNHNVHHSVFGCNCERLLSRWSQMASECVARTTSCCCFATDTLASCALIR